MAIKQPCVCAGTDAVWATRAQALRELHRARGPGVQEHTGGSEGRADHAGGAAEEVPVGDRPIRCGGVVGRVFNGDAARPRVRV